MLIWRPANAILTTMTKALLQLAGSGEECQVFPWEGKPLLYARTLSEPRDLVIDDALFGGREPLTDYDLRLWDADIHRWNQPLYQRGAYPGHATILMTARPAGGAIDLQKSNRSEVSLPGKRWPGTAQPAQQTEISTLFMWDFPQRAVRAAASPFT